jgi:hypothetical protein
VTLILAEGQNWSATAKLSDAMTSSAGLSALENTQIVIDWLRATHFDGTLNGAGDVTCPERVRTRGASSRRMKSMGNRARIAVGCLLLATLVTTGWIILSGRLSSTAGGAGSPGPAATSELSADEKASLEAALTASDPALISSSLAPAIRPGFERKPFRLLPEGAHPTIDATGLVAEGDQASVPVTVSGSAAKGSWSLILVQVGDR